MYARLKSDARHIKAMFQVFGWWGTSQQELDRFNAACRKHCGHDAITVSVDGMNGFAFYKITTVSPHQDYGGFVVAQYEIIPAAELRERAEQIAAAGERKHIGFSQGDDGYLLHESTYSAFHKTNLALLVDDWMEALPTVPREAGPERPIVNVKESTVAWKGTTYPVDFEVAQLFDLLVKSYPLPVKVNIELPGFRMDNKITNNKNFPRQLKALIQTAKGAGTSLVLP